MSIYLKVLYDQWTQGRSETEVKEHWYEFVLMSMKLLSRTEEEIIQELKSTNWFMFDNNSVK